MTLRAVSATRLFDGHTYYQDSALVWEGQTITSILPLEKLPPNIEHQHFEGALIAPGFIDLQVNGGGGVMFNSDISAAAMGTICEAHRAHGTAYLLPTLISSTPEDLSQALSSLQQAKQQHIPGVLGVHLEGPWLNVDKKGAHNASLFYAPTAEQLAQFPWPKEGKVLVTAAVENIEVSALEYLKQVGVTLSCGHSNAQIAQLTEQKLSLVDGFTHLFNAMSPLEGREPGTVGAALKTDHAWCSIITDGIHVHPDSVRIASKIKPTGKLLVVTDAMASVGSENNSFVLDGEVISVKDNKLVNSRGSLAGAHIGMDQSIANLIAWGFAEEESLRMASTYPAQALACHNLGLLRPGMTAAATILNADYQTTGVLVDGKLF